MSLEKCGIIDLPKISDSRGSLSFVESKNQIPFEIKRVYYLYDIPQGSERGAHGHKELQQLIIAISGSFDVVLDDGNNVRTFHMSGPHYGLKVAPMMWRDIINISRDAVCMVLASECYDEADYYRNYSEFESAVRIGI